MISFPVFLINLDDSPARLAAAQGNCTAHGVEFTRVSGYNGRKLDPLSVPEYDSAAALNYMGRDLNGGEIGCYFSHIRALEAFLETGAPYGLVLEDDMLPNEHAFALTQSLIDWQAKRGAPDWHVANVGADRMKIMSAVAPLRHAEVETTIFRGHYFPMLATALLWTREGAQDFVNSYLPLDCPLDNATRRWLTATDMGLTLSPPLFTTTGAASDIDTSHTAAKRGTEGRTRGYGWLKAKRMYGDKFRALRHKIRFNLRNGKIRP